MSSESASLSSAIEDLRRSGVRSSDAGAAGWPSASRPPPPRIAFVGLAANLCGCGSAVSTQNDQINKIATGWPTLSSASLRLAANLRHQISCHCQRVDDFELYCGAECARSFQNVGWQPVAIRLGKRQAKMEEEKKLYIFGGKNRPGSCVVRRHLSSGCLHLRDLAPQLLDLRTSTGGRDL